MKPRVVSGILAIVCLALLGSSVAAQSMRWNLRNVALDGGGTTELSQAGVDGSSTPWSVVVKKDLMSESQTVKAQATALSMGNAEAILTLECGSSTPELTIATFYRERKGAPRALAWSTVEKWDGTYGFYYRVDSGSPHDSRVYIKQRLANYGKLSEGILVESRPNLLQSADAHYGGLTLGQVSAALKQIEAAAFDQKPDSLRKLFGGSSFSNLSKISEAAWNGKRVPSVAITGSLRAPEVKLVLYFDAGANNVDASSVIRGASLEVAQPKRLPARQLVLELSFPTPDPNETAKEQFRFSFEPPMLKPADRTALETICWPPPSGAYSWTAAEVAALARR